MSGRAVRPPEPIEPVERSEHGRSALTVIGIAVALVVSQQLVLTIALPQVTADLRATQTELQWILDSYPVVLAALLLPGGALGDRWGRRRTLLLGLVLMATATLGLAMANSAEAAIAWRVGAAVGAALVFPATLSTLTTAFSGQQRARAVAVWTIAAVLGAFVGMLGAGVLLEFWSWRSIPWALAAIGGVLLFAVAVVVPESARNPEVVLDPIGSTQVVVGIGAVTFGIVSAGEHGLLAPRSAIALLLGFAVTAAFLRRQWHAEHPLLAVRKLVGVSIGMGLLATTSLFFVIYATSFVTVQYLAIVEGLTALQIGATLCTYAVALVPLTFASTRWSRRIGMGPMIVAGMLVMALSDVLFADLELANGLGHYIALAVLFGAGIGLMQAPATEAVVAALPDSEQGLASAVSDITRELGAALGIAVAGSVLIANLEPAAGPAETFLTAWPETNLALAISATLCALVVAALAFREPRPPRDAGRTAARRPRGPRRPVLAAPEPVASIDEVPALR